MKKRIEQPAEDLFSEVVAEPDATGTTSKQNGVQVDSPGLVDLGEHFGESLAEDEGEKTGDNDIAVGPPIIETCEPQAIESVKKAIGGNPNQSEIEKFVATAKEAFGILAVAFQNTAKAIAAAMSDPAVQEAIKDATDDPEGPLSETFDPGPTGETESIEPPASSPKPKSVKTLIPSIVDDAPMWSTPLADTKIFDGIKRFGDQRKKSVIEACPTVADLQRQVEGPGLTKIEGVGKKLAEQIAANLAAWVDANGEDVPQDLPTDSPPGAPPVAPEARPTVEPEPPATQASHDDGGPNRPGSSLDGLRLLPDDSTDAQQVKSRQILAELVVRYRAGGTGSHEIASEHQQYFERGKIDAENDVPGDDCIYTADLLAYAWAWGWVVETLGGDDE